MRKIIPTFSAPEAGNVQTDIVGNSNYNFLQLYNRSKNYGFGLQKFLMKLRSNESRFENIKFSILGDSILGFWNATEYEMTLYFETLYPNKIFTKEQVKLGGTGAPYFMPGLWQICQSNPDLIIIMEWEGWTENDYLEMMFRYIRKYSSADIAIIPWTLHGVEMDKLSAGNISGFVSGQDGIMRQYYFSMCSKYNVAMIDIHQPWFRVLLDGTETEATLLADGLHPSANGYSYWSEEFNKHFSPLWDNEHLQYGSDSKIWNTIFFREALELPDITDLTISGTSWAVDVVETDEVIAVLKTNNATDYIEATIEGIGFELSTFGQAVGEMAILIDGAAPSTFMKNYATQIAAGNELEKMYKVIVNSNILADNETERYFYITIQTLTRVAGEITECTYRINDITKGAILVAENLNALADEIINYDGGSITIPAYYASVRNLRDDNDTMQVGDQFTFYIRKHFFDAISQTADSVRTITRFSGLERGEHTIRITCNSGTISLDSIMELK